MFSFFHLAGWLQLTVLLCPFTVQTDSQRHVLLELFSFIFQEGCKSTYYGTYRRPTIYWCFLSFTLQEGCKLLYVLLRYTQTANYFWMFCEGFYLHRLIVHAFEVPKNLIWYYLIGFGELHCKCKNRIWNYLIWFGDLVGKSKNSHVVLSHRNWRVCGNKPHLVLPHRIWWLGW